MYGHTKKSSSLPPLTSSIFSNNFPVLKPANFEHIYPKKPTGNKHAEREIYGELLVCLALYQMVYPKATIDKIWAYLFNLNPADNQQPPFSQSKVVHAEKLHQLSQKFESTTCNHTYLPINSTK